MLKTTRQRYTHLSDPFRTVASPFHCCIRTYPCRFCTSCQVIHWHIILIALGVTLILYCNHLDERKKRYIPLRILHVTLGDSLKHHPNCPGRDSCSGRSTSAWKIIWLVAGGARASDCVQHSNNWLTPKNVYWVKTNCDPQNVWNYVLNTESI